MKPLLYHLEYHVEEGHFEGISKGKEIKILVGNDGGVQTLLGSGSGGGRVKIGSGKSVLFALDHDKEVTKLVFRAYAENEFLGEVVEVFRGPTFPKRSALGEPGSYTLDTDLCFLKENEIRGAAKAFIRLTSFGENIVSECVKDGDCFRVRLTSLILERNVEKKKNVRPWWVTLDGRRLRFSRWLKMLEKEDCTKEVFLKVKKSGAPEEENAITSSNVPFAAPPEEVEVNFMESAEASLKNDFTYFFTHHDDGPCVTEERGSQVDLGDYQLFLQNALKTNICVNCSAQRIQNESTDLSYAQMSSMSAQDQQRSVDVSSNEKNEAEVSPNIYEFKDLTHSSLGSDFHLNEVIDTQLPENYNASEVVTDIKSDDIFLFNGSANNIVEDTLEDQVSDSNQNEFIGEKPTNQDKMQSQTISNSLFLAECMVSEIIESLTYNMYGLASTDSQHHREHNAPNIPKGAAYGDIESSLDFSGPNSTLQTEACIELSTVDSKLLERRSSLSMNAPREEQTVEEKVNFFNNAANQHLNEFMGIGGSSTETVKEKQLCAITEEHLQEEIDLALSKSLDQRNMPAEISFDNESDAEDKLYTERQSSQSNVLSAETNKINSTSSQENMSERFKEHQVAFGRYQFLSENAMEASISGNCSAQIIQNNFSDLSPFKKNLEENMENMDLYSAPILPMVTQNQLLINDSFNNKNEAEVPSNIYQFKDLPINSQGRDHIHRNEVMDIHLPESYDESEAVTDIKSDDIFLFDSSTNTVIEDTLEAQVSDSIQDQFIEKQLTNRDKMHSPTISEKSFLSESIITDLIYSLANDIYESMSTLEVDNTRGECSIIDSVSDEIGEGIMKELNKSSSDSIDKLNTEYSYTSKVEDLQESTSEEVGDLNESNEPSLSLKEHLNSQSNYSFDEINQLSKTQLTPSEEFEVTLGIIKECNQIINENSESNAETDLNADPRSYIANNSECTEGANDLNRKQEEIEDYNLEDSHNLSSMTSGKSSETLTTEFKSSHECSSKMSQLPTNDILDDELVKGTLDKGAASETA